MVLYWVKIDLEKILSKGIDQKDMTEPVPIPEEDHVAFAEAKGALVYAFYSKESVSVAGVVSYLTNTGSRIEVTCIISSTESANKTAMRTPDAIYKWPDVQYVGLVHNYSCVNVKKIDEKKIQPIYYKLYCEGYNHKIY